MKTHPDPQNFQRLGNRDELTALGEGQQLRVIGYLLCAKLELGGESCNCYFRTEETTENWELHPIFRLEYCPKGKTCKVDSKENWKDIDH